MISFENSQPFVKFSHCKSTQFISISLHVIYSFNNNYFVFRVFGKNTLLYENYVTPIPFSLLFP